MPERFGVREEARIIKAVDELAKAEGCDRSAWIRRLIRLELVKRGVIDLPLKEGKRQP
jgi:metal-responsive CopG/Arc/MetJ family transcriptional regulator